MVTRRQCAAVGNRGEPCGMPPLKDSQFCWSHSPDHAQEVQEARRLGGLRRRRESTIAGAYDFEGLGTVNDIRRLLEVAVMDTLELPNSIARSRTLAYLAQVALRALEVGDFEKRIVALEQCVRSQTSQPSASGLESDERLCQSEHKEEE